MSELIENIQGALQYGASVRPNVGGFPYLAEFMRQAGVRRNEWHLPSLQRVYVTDRGTVVDQGEPLLTGMADVAAFDPDALVAALRADQEGRAPFEQFVAACWAAGVVRWVVDLDARTCTYYGGDGQSYVEDYPGVSLPAPVVGAR